jgi:hypothetical protein
MDEKLATLHTGEVILSKKDTETFLKAIDITRSISEVLPNIKIPKFITSIPPEEMPDINIVIDSFNKKDDE